MERVVTEGQVSEDKLMLCRMYSPHAHDFIWQRPDGSRYVIEIRKDQDDYTYELDDEGVGRVDREQDHVG